MDIRNIAIIAHVDHGKTTLVDQLLKQSGSFREHQQVAERAMDSNVLEKERGITILAKCTSVAWKGTRINIVDTPGHADFGGEVERILGMVDGAIVLVDAAEGALPQTKFVLTKALARGIKPIVVVNKVDRQDARPDEVHTEVFDLFAALGATDEQLDFPMLYASGRQGWADEELEGARKDLAPMFDLVLRHVPATTLDKEAPFAMVASILEYDNFLGRVLTGRIEQGRAKLNMPVKVLRAGRLRGRDRTPDQAAELPRPGPDHGGGGGGRRHRRRGRPDRRHRARHGRRLRDHRAAARHPGRPADAGDDVPRQRRPAGWARGQEGHVRQIRDRLCREAEGNVAIKVSDSNENDAFEVAGRGELQLGVLIETMRREGFELAIGRPRVLTRQNPETGEREEPMEEVLVDVDEPYSGAVVEKLSRRKARDAGHAPLRRRQGAPHLPHPEPRPDRLPRRVPDRHARHRHHEPPVRRLRALGGPIEGRRNGSLISSEAGRGGAVCAVVPAGARHAVREPWREGLRRHDPGRALARLATST